MHPMGRRRGSGLEETTEDNVSDASARAEMDAMGTMRTFLSPEVDLDGRVAARVEDLVGCQRAVAAANDVDLPGGRGSW